MPLPSPSATLTPTVRTRGCGSPDELLAAGGTVSGIGSAGTAGPHAPAADVQRAGLPRLPAALVRRVRLDHGHVHADVRPGVAGLHVDRLGVSTRCRRIPRHRADAHLFPV